MQVPQKDLCMVNVATLVQDFHDMVEEIVRRHTCQSTHSLAQAACVGNVAAFEQGNSENIQPTSSQHSHISDQLHQTITKSMNIEVSVRTIPSHHQQQFSDAFMRLSQTNDASQSVSPRTLTNARTVSWVRETESDKEVNKLAQAMAVKSSMTNSIKRLKRYSTHEEPAVEAARKTSCDPFLSFLNSNAFDHLSALLVISNAAFLGLNAGLMAERETATEPVTMEVITDVYTFLFVMELCLRLAAHGRVFFSRSELLWNLFDVAIVSISTVQTFCRLFLTAGYGKNFRAINVLRACRALRIVRVIRAISLLRELRLLLSGILGTLMSCFWAFVLLFCLMYGFSIAFTNAAIIELYECPGCIRDVGHAEDVRRYFGTLPRSLETLFKSICGGVNWEEPGDILKKFRTNAWLWVSLFYMYIAFTLLAVLNVVTALFCQSAVENVLYDQEVLLGKKLSGDLFLKDKLYDLFLQVDNLETSDASPKGVFTFDELERFLEKDAVKAKFSILGIETSDAWTLFKLLDKDESQTITSKAFVDGCMSLRGSATRLDLEKIQYRLDFTSKKMDRFMRHMVKVLKPLEAPIFQTCENVVGATLEAPALEARDHAARAIWQAPTLELRESTSRLLDAEAPTLETCDHSVGTTSPI